MKINYRKQIEEFLSNQGVDYMFQKKIKYKEWLIIKGLFSVLGLGLGLGEGLGWAIIFAYLGWCFPTILVRISNRSDNYAMLEDIKEIYDTLRIQTKAGVYLTHSLGECYLGVRHPRLKAALLDLSNGMLAKTDLNIELDLFSKKFQNSYVHTLCIIIKQSMESGQMLQSLGDISEQLADMQHTLAIREREALERKIQILELLFFVGVLGISFYTLSFELIQSIYQF